MSAVSGRLSTIASAIANARRWRKGVPSVVNVLEVLSDQARSEVMDDARAVLIALRAPSEAVEELWGLPKEQRLDAFIERYLDLDEMTGNRSFEEKAEMQEIAEAILPTLIRERMARV